MGRVSRARKVATAAVYGGGGIGVLGALATGLIVSQIKHARQAIPPVDAAPLPCDGEYGGDLRGEPLRFAVLGDSSAAGLGVENPAQTPGAVLAGNLARITGRPVQLHCLAVVGALSQDLHSQVRQATPLRPDLTMIMVGGNDVTNRVWPSTAVRHLAHAVRALREIDSTVVVGTCPDLGTVQPIRPPLRWMARRWSRELAAAQTIAVVEAGGRTVSLGDLLGPEFTRAPDRLFSADQFHPSATGYAAAAAAVLPTFLVALAVADEPVTRPRHPSADLRRSGVSSLPRAAVTAAYHAGTEVSGAKVAGAERGPAGRWAELRQWMLGWTRLEPPRSPETAERTTPVGPRDAAEPTRTAGPLKTARAPTRQTGDVATRQAGQRRTDAGASTSRWFAIPSWLRP